MQMCLPEFWSSSGACTAWLESKEYVFAEVGLGLNSRFLHRNMLCWWSLGVRQEHGLDEGFELSNVVVSFRRGLLGILN